MPTRDTYIPLAQPPIPEPPPEEPFTWGDHALLLGAWILRLCTWLLVIMCLLAPLGRWSWLGCLGVELAPFLILGLIPALYVYRQQTPATAVVLLAMCCAAWPWLRFHYRERAAAPTGEETALRVLVANVGWWNGTDPDVLARTIVAEYADILVLPEVPPAVVSRLRKHGKWSVWHTTQVREGPYSLAIATHARRGGEPKTILVPGPERSHGSGSHRQNFQGVNPIIRLPIRLADRTVQLFAVHPPPPTQPRLFRHRRTVFTQLLEHIDASSDPIIVAGDFNATAAAAVMTDLQHRGLRLSPGPRAATWGPSELGLPLLAIDHIWARGFHMTSGTTVPLPGSDHRGWLVSLAYPETEWTKNKDR
jgi:endonuclease/exonuclease/phosphatase (EEP) superfamily protein YafD